MAEWLPGHLRAQAFVRRLARTINGNLVGRTRALEQRPVLFAVDHGSIRIKGILVVSALSDRLCVLGAERMLQHPALSGLCRSFGGVFAGMGDMLGDHCLRLLAERTCAGDDIVVHVDGMALSRPARPDARGAVFLAEILGLPVVAVRSTDRCGLARVEDLKRFDVNPTLGPSGRARLAGEITQYMTVNQHMTVR